MATITPKSKANMDPQFEKQLRQLKDNAAAAYQAGKQANQIPYDRPVGWNGDPFDYEGMAKPFDRSSANNDLVAAVSDSNNPGTTGDVVVTTTMINQLSAMESAFRVRQTLRRCRAKAHSLGRKRGHGSDKGPFIQLGVAYARSLLKQAKKQ